MATSGNGDSKRRLEILEKAYLEDRERARKNDARWLTNDERWRANDERWRANDERWRANSERLDRILDRLEENDRKHAEFQEDFQDVMRTLVKHDRQVRRLEESQAASLRILRRLLEK